MQHLPRACAPLLLTAALLCISLSPLVSAHDSHDNAAHHHPHSLHDHAHTHVHDGHDHGDHGHDHGNGHTHGHGHGHDEVNSGSAATCSASSATCRARQAQASLTQRSVLLLSGAPIWAAALLSSALTGAASLFAVVLLPLRGPVLKAMLPFAAGALLADCALHLLPLLYATSDSHADHAHATLRGGVGALLAGIAAFFVLDALSRRLSGGACGHAHGKGQGHARGERAARMNLAADAVHNLCDGLSIGAAYLASRRAGVATTLAVLLHELPQEVGDFAVLLRAGWSWRRALLANVACAGTAVLGTAAALAVDQVASQAAREAILPFAAGGLLYLALTAILPDVLEDVEEGVPKKGSKGETVPVGFLAFVARVSVAVAAAALGVATVAAIERLHDH